MAAKEQDINRRAHLDRAALEAYWMPFTANRQFKDNPRLIERADGCYYITVDGRRVLDGLSGLWCCGAGHNRPKLPMRRAATADARLFAGVSIRPSARVRTGEQNHHADAAGSGLRLLYELNLKRPIRR